MAIGQNYNVLTGREEDYDIPLYPGALPAYPGEVDATTSIWTPQERQAADVQPIIDPEEVLRAASSAVKTLPSTAPVVLPLAAGVATGGLPLIPQALASIGAGVAGQAVDEYFNGLPIHEAIPGLLEQEVENEMLGQAIQAVPKVAKTVLPVAKRLPLVGPIFTAGSVIAEAIPRLAKTELPFYPTGRADRLTEDAYRALVRTDKSLDPEVAALLENSPMMFRHATTYPGQIEELMPAPGKPEVVKVGGIFGSADKTTSEGYAGLTSGFRNLDTEKQAEELRRYFAKQEADFAAKRQKKLQLLRERVPKSYGSNDLENFAANEAKITEAVSNFVKDGNISHFTNAQIGPDALEKWGLEIKSYKKGKFVQTQLSEQAKARGVKPGDPKVYEYYVKSTNPFDFDAKFNPADLPKMKKALRSMGHYGSDVQRALMTSTDEGAMKAAENARRQADRMRKLEQAALTEDPLTDVIEETVKSTRTNSDVVFNLAEQQHFDANGNLLFEGRSLVQELAHRRIPAFRDYIKKTYGKDLTDDEIQVFGDIFQTAGIGNKLGDYLDDIEGIVIPDQKLMTEIIRLRDKGNAGRVMMTGKVKKETDLGFPDEFDDASAYDDVWGPDTLDDEFNLAETVEKLLTEFKDVAIKDFPPDVLPSATMVFTDLLKKMDYDSLMHVGGGKVNIGSAPHRVIVAFDSGQLVNPKAVAEYEKRQYAPKYINYLANGLIGIGAGAGAAKVRAGSESR